MINRYRGSLLSFAWLVMVPIVMVAIYTSTFLGILRFRPNGTEEASPLHFGLQLYAGLLVYSFLTEVLVRAPGCVREQANLVKKVVFPLSVLPLVPVASACVRQAAGLCTLLVFLSFIEGRVYVMWLWLPLVLLLLVAIVAGLSYALAAIGTYLPDIGHAVGLLTSILLFLSPIFYPLSAVQGIWSVLIWCNPIAIPIETMRNIIISGSAPSTEYLAYMVLTSCICLVCGWWIFRRVCKGFCDVL